MFNQFTKPIIAAFGSILMLMVLLACQSTGAMAHSENRITVNDHNGHSLSIRRQDSDKPVYVLDGQEYRWEDLSPVQQAKLEKIEAKMVKAEAKLRDKEKALMPVIHDLESQTRELESKVRKIEAIARTAEIETADLDTKSIRELEKKMQQVAKQMRVHEVEMREIEKSFRDKEVEMRKVEKQFRIDASAFEKEINQNIDEVIEVLTAG